MSFCLDERISQVVLFLDKPEHHRSQYMKLVQPFAAAHPDKVANRRVLEREPFEVRPSYRDHAKIHATVCLFCVCCIYALDHPDVLPADGVNPLSELGYV